MDSEASVMVLCAQGFQEQQVRVEISTRFNRRHVPEIEKHIEAVWNSRVTKDSWLFNGAKFRLHSAELSSPPFTNCSREIKINTRTSDNAKTDKQLGKPSAQKPISAPYAEGDGTSATETQNSAVNPTVNGSSCCGGDADAPQTQVLSLQLGLTWYRDFLGTNWSGEASNLQRQGEQEFGDPQALLAQPLGVGAILLTSDGQVVMLRRSQRVAEAAGLLDIPGGHPEPKAVCQDVSEEAISVEVLQGHESAVVSEIFSSVCAEIRDEVNVPLKFLGPPLLMGIALNHTSAGRPSAEFFIRCSLTMDEVRDFYGHGGPEAHESTAVVFLSRAEVLQLDENSPLWSELCPSAKGAVLLYKLVRPDEP